MSVSREANVLSPRSYDTGIMSAFMTLYTKETALVVAEAPIGTGDGAKWRAVCSCSAFDTDANLLKDVSASSLCLLLLIFHPSLMPSWSTPLSVLERMDLKSALVTLLGVSIVMHLLNLFNMLRAKAYFPRMFPPFQPFGLPGVLLPTNSWFIGYQWHWVRRFQTYTRNDTVEIVPLILGGSNLWTSNVDVARQVAVGSHRSSWFKPREGSLALSYWGSNIIAADGQLWRKHRRIVGPAFSTDLYKLVWKQSQDNYNDMMQAEGWTGLESVDIPVIQNITIKFALLIICNCGFGLPSTWAAPTTDDGGMSMQTALQIVSVHHLSMIFLPKWFFYFPTKTFKQIRTARNLLVNFMQTQAAERKVDVTSGKPLQSDLFTKLVAANQEEEGKYTLSDDELIGNIFAFMFAGHETTAHTLAAALGLIALHQSTQDEVVQQIIDVIGCDRDPEYEDYNKLDKVLAIFYEAVRLYPAGHIMMREAAEDTILQVPNPIGQGGFTAVPIKKGTKLNVDMIGMQYNPRHFEDPAEFRPSRWYGLPTDSEAFTAFSVGTRACIGRRFATIEATCFLAMLLRDWRVKPLLSEGETTSEWRKRVLDGHIALTLAAHDIPLTLERRR